MECHNRMAAIFVLLTLISAGLCCDVDTVAVYKVQLQMMWDSEFVNYPADSKRQWSQVFGQSHNKSYALYRIGEPASPAVREFAQFSHLEGLMGNGDEESKVFDQFIAPGVETGKGETEGIVFVDGEHTLVSFLCRMEPSPNWFIGVDSLDLCVDSTWVEEVTLDLEPLDAGVTSNSDAPESVEKISHRNPDYPGSSFFYRKLRHTPAIAKVEFSKVKEYSKKELNDFARKELFSDIKQNRKKNILNTNNDVQIKDDFTTKSPFNQLKDLEEDPFGTPKPNNPDNNVVVVTSRPTFESKDIPKDSLENMDQVVLAVATGHKLGLGKHLPRHFRSRLHHAVNHVKRPKDKDCVVSEWGSWTPCTEPCEGETVRTRSIRKKKSGNGRDCPVLFEKRNCKDRCRGDGDYDW